MAFAIRSNGNAAYSLPSPLSLKLLRYFSRISNSVKPKVGEISDVFCVLAISLLGNFAKLYLRGGIPKNTKSQLIHNALYMN